MKDLPPAAVRRIVAGEPWLTVWREQLTVPLPTLAKKSGLTMERLIVIERGGDVPNRDELAAIARGLGTTVEMIEAVQP